MPDKVLLISHEDMIEHDPGQGHPERPARLKGLLDLCRRAGRPWVKAMPAPREAIERVHTPSYVEAILATRGAPTRFDADTTTSEASVEAALLAAGAGIQLVDALIASPDRPGFALVRPPGHHAERDRAMGFCLFNNIAIAAAHAIEHHGLSRVAIIDWDVHHGNGTQHIFEGRADVLYVSVHQSPAYPGTGEMNQIGSGTGTGHTVNLPLPPGCGDREYRSVFETIILPIIRTCRPEMILVSTGFDGHRDDPLASMNITENGFAAMTAVVASVARETCQGRLGFILEGGYDIAGLTQSTETCLLTLEGKQAPAIDLPREREAAVIDILRLHHAVNWPILNE